MTTPQPAMDPSSSEADEVQLSHARAQGDAYRRAVQHMAQEVADDGGMQDVGGYSIAYALEEAEGMYHLAEGVLEWRNPEEENLHVEIAVMDAADGRFVPGLDVEIDLIAPDGSVVGPVTLPMLWHPMISHYGANVTVPADGKYDLRVRVGAAPFMRHDEINGRRFADPVETTFSGVSVERDSEPVDPPT
ncbi:iron transporter [Demequina sp. SO4-13]|uniref:iron transporter n=1 Tax=Demequina sp. SO4-13 TaxID=3401027 RepID=UPI003AF7DBBD